MNVSEIHGALAALRQRTPLVHNITNYVVMNMTANALLAIGASPAMVHAVEEAGEFAAHRQRAGDQHRHALAALGRGACERAAGSGA